jgi:MFS family permease
MSADETTADEAAADEMSADDMTADETRADEARVDDSSGDEAGPLDPPAAWRMLAVLSVGILLAEAPWFSSGAVAPLLAAEWQPTGVELSLLTVAVQLGFAVAALALAMSGAADVLPGRFLFAIGAFVTAAANLGFAWLATGPTDALPYRALTGAGIAAVYPVAMKLIAGWFRARRGLALGFVIGAIAAGSAMPHLFRAIGSSAGADWRVIVTWASVAALAGGVVALAWARPGPYDIQAPRFSLRIAAQAFRERSVRLANLGYLGHMWELFAMWTWVPLFLAASFAAAGLAEPTTAAVASFAVVAAGWLGCSVGGVLADRFGRTALTIGALAISGGCSLAIGFLYGGAPVLVVGLALVWGLTVAADSPQFSAAVSELAPPGTAGSALAIQTAAGFTLTAVTILAVGAVDAADGAGWRIAFGSLAIGPAIGIAAMWRLRGLPEATRMASGHR